MTELRPVAFRYDGEAMIPLNRYFAALADKQYEVGQTYVLIPHEQRSRAEHNFYFACIANAWQNLRDDLADEFQSPEQLRAWALVKAGYADKTVIKCASTNDAIELAALVKTGPKIRIVEVTGRIVTAWTPHSQSMKAMGRQQFGASKRAVLDVISSLIGVSADALASNAQAA